MLASCIISAEANVGPVSKEEKLSKLFKIKYKYVSPMPFTRCLQLKDRFIIPKY